MHNISSAAHDFDFLFGSWRVEHRRLRARLAGSNEWDEFTGTCDAQPLLGGHGNVDDNTLDLPEGSYRAVSFRAFDEASQTWAIWWLDGRRPHHLDVPVVGGFSEGRGEFIAHDELDGRPILVRFQWLDTGSRTPRWEQAFSVDDGATWETNWTMTFHPASDMTNLR
jgi:hypothetical protein